MSDKWLNHNLYLGDWDETELYDWLCETVAPVLSTSQAEYNYFVRYHGDNNLWTMHSADVSDVTGSIYDTVTVISFLNREDAIMAKLKFGGSLE